MNNPYRSGTADWWYSGAKADLWIEYKFIPRIPVRALIVPDLSPRQKDWLDGRLSEGRNVAVIVGCPEGGVLYRERFWLEALEPEQFRARVLERNALARWIVLQTCPEGA